LKGLGVPKVVLSELLERTSVCRKIREYKIVGASETDFQEPGGVRVEHV